MNLVKMLNKALGYTVLLQYQNSLTGCQKIKIINRYFDEHNNHAVLCITLVPVVERNTVKNSRRRAALLPSAIGQMIHFLA
jgi:hypothetical protein